MSGADYFSGANAALFTDLYQLTMAQAYLESGHTGWARFDLFVRSLPKGRNFLIACGQHEATAFLEALHFSTEDLEYLASLDKFSDTLLDHLRELRFTGEVEAVPEGTLVFAGEPILSVHAPVVEAQILESWLLNQVHLQTVLASKAARVALAAQGRPVLDFGLRRIHGADAGLKSARAFHIAGIAATSNMLAGKHYGVPVAGTMAHSYIQSFTDEAEALRAFAASFPDTVLLVDTYDTLEGVRKVIRLAEELGDDFKVQGVRLDSGNLGALAVDARRMLDEAGLEQVQIVASGGLDEYKIAKLIQDGAPIDGFGVGTAMGVPDDAPHLDIAYKLSEYDGEPRMKLSTGKQSLPGRKQVFRFMENGRFHHDVIATAGETLDGEPQLRKLMHDGRVLAEPDLAAARERAAQQIALLPPALLDLQSVSEPGYSVRLSEALQQRMHRLQEHLRPPAG